MSPMQSPMDRLGEQLELAAARQVAAQRIDDRVPHRRRWSPRNTLVAILVVGLGSAGVAVAATALLRHGQPVPLRGGKPVAGRSEGAPIPGSIRIIATAPDPDGGPPWAMRFWTTDRAYACFQVGRYDAGRVGLISGPPADRVFHPMQIGTSRDGVSGCHPADGAGHARVALHESTATGGATTIACRDNAYGTDRQGRWVHVEAPPGCQRPSRTVDVGLLGPAARSLTATVDGKERTVTPAGPEGAYLVVQRYVEPVTKVVGYHHADPKLDFSTNAESRLALTPATQTIKRVVYDDGACRVYPSSVATGACLRHTAWVKFPTITPGDVRARVRAWAVDDRRIRVRFTARERVVNRRSGYSVSLIPDPTTSNIHHGFTVVEYAHDIEAGETARLTLSRGSYPPGRFTIRVAFRTAPNAPSLSQLPWQAGPLVGVTHVRIG